MTIIAAADGSSLGNPGPAGWAWYIDERNWRAGGWTRGTNNQGELMAVLDLLRATADRPQEPLRILCDSQYVINCLTSWMPGWKLRGWRKADGSPVLNVDLLRQIDAELTGRDYEFEWVKGHAGHELNEAADSRARAAALAYQRGSEPPTGPGLNASTARPVTQSKALVEEIADGGADLFSMLDPEQPAATEMGSEILSALRCYDREALGADPSRLATLLAEEFEEVGGNGRVWERDAVIHELGQDRREQSVTLEPIGASVAADRAILLYRVNGPSGPSVQSSHWQRQDGRWRLRFRQTTPRVEMSSQG